MVDLDYIDKIDYQLRVASTFMNNETELFVSADCDDKAVVFTTRNTENKENMLTVVADKKAAKMIVDFLNNYFDL